MSHTTPRSASRVGVLAVLVGLVAALVVLLPTAPADAAAKGRVRGYVVAPHGDTPPTKVSWFTEDWRYLGSRSVSHNGSYSLTLKPGTYRLQFTDKRPSWDVTKLAATDTTVVVRTGRTAIRNVRMQRGAAITGRVKVHGKAGARATITAANAAEQSFSTVANAQGEFALGGLPAGSYSVFTYDHGRAYVAKSTYIKHLQPGQPKDLRLHLGKRAGSLLVDLYAGNAPIDKTLVVTAISKRTGQFWTVKAKHGAAHFRGLYPGRYKLVVPGYGEYLARTADVQRGVVRPGRPAFGSFRLTQRGGAFVGRVLAGDDGEPLARTTVRLYDAAGSIIADTTTNASGTFRVGGRLGTMKGITLVAFDGAHLDLFGVLRMKALSIKVAQDKQLGDLELPAKPSATVIGAVVDASNIAIPLAGATVQLLASDRTVLGTTTSDDDGVFEIGKRLASQSGVSVVVTPASTSVELDGVAYTCQYAATSHGGIVLEAGDVRDLGVVGASRKAGGACTAPLGDGVKH